jgi:hypothetical protein
VEITPEGRRRLRRPRLRLASLYHPENFPLPRFPLAISDKLGVSDRAAAVAQAIRRGLLS